MALFKSGNPSLSEKVFSQSIAVQGTEVMTVRGTISKFSFLFVMVLASAVFTWHMYYQGGNVTPYLYGGGIGGFVNVNRHCDIYSDARVCSFGCAGFSVGLASDSIHSVWNTPGLSTRS